MSRLDAAIARGINFVEAARQTDGSFLSYSSFDPITFTDPRVEPTIFGTALISSILPATVTDATRQYLLSQRSPEWSWNYWQRGSQMPAYPDDLDDTAVVIAALAPDLPAAGLAGLGQLLISAEVAVGGPYQTWVTDSVRRPDWYSIDPVVNANIAYALQRLDVRLPSLQFYLENLITEDRLQSAFYPPAAVLYFLSRVNGIRKGRLQAKAALLSKNASLFDRTLLVQMLPGQDEFITHLISAQRPDGSWPAAGLYRDPDQSGQRRYAGSPALTTSLVCQALAAYRKPSPVVDAAARRPVAYDLVMKEFVRLPGEFQQAIGRALDTIELLDRGGQVSQPASRFATACRVTISRLILDKLDTASLMGWLAYTLADDLMDGDQPATVLPLIMTAQRRSAELFQAISPYNKNYRRFVNGVFDTVDAANYQELLTLRFPDQRLPVGKTIRPGNLADKSWGHVLASSAVLYQAGIGHAKRRQWSLFMRHYLIARQLNDDAHDWQEDLAAGRLTFPLSLLSRCESSTGYSRYYWQTVIPQVCRLIDKHCGAADRALSNCEFIVDKSEYDGWTAKLRAAAAVTIQRRQESLEFMTAFKAV